MTIKDALSDYYNSWNEGFKTKNDSKIKKFMATSFVGYWAYSTIEKPEEYDYHYDIVSVLNQYPESTQKEFDLISITERGNGDNYLVYGTETSLINGQPHLAKCLYVWAVENGDWKLLREYIEIEQ
ncbi:DUF4440 domain-containing protein [Ornithinibacillus xuwenensis]|uniref:DUF4440 domain-containing protein n=1 Tax=Ornithinibacillus xuwenensis TaxID=3144668 RepID=A0ABU9XFD7_9BACI